MSDKCGIAIIQIKDVNAIIQIAELCFGKYYLTMNQLHKYMQAKGVFIYYHKNEKILGFCIGIVHLKNDTITDKSIHNSTHLLPVGIIQNIAVHPVEQNNGIGTLLLETCIHKLTQIHHCKTLYYPAWKQSHSFLFTKKLKSKGFGIEKEIENYWTAESIENNFFCARCGAPPCSCSMALFSKKNVL
jgi:ribosomal protein S18 acetylase RimI-like enzyme